MKNEETLKKLAERASSKLSQVRSDIVEVYAELKLFKDMTERLNDDANELMGKIEYIAGDLEDALPSIEELKIRLNVEENDDEA